MNHRQMNNSVKTGRSLIMARSSFLRGGAFFVNLAVTLLLTPLVIGSLGDKMYGLWILVGTLFGFYDLFNFGLASANQRFVSQAIGKKDHKLASSYASTSFVVFSAIGLLAIVVTLAIFFGAKVFFPNVKSYILFRQVVVILGIGIALSFPSRTFFGVLSSNLRYDLISFVEIIKILVRSVLIVFFLKLGYKILALAVLTFVTEVSGYFALLILSVREAPYIKYSLFLVDKKKLTQMFRYSFYTFVNQVADKIRFNIDNFVIAGVLGLASVTVYSIAARLMKYYKSFVFCITGITTPLFSQYEGKQDYENIKKKLLFFIKISVFISVFLGVMIFVGGEFFIIRWVGEKYSFAYQLCLIFVVPFAIMSGQLPSTQLLYGISKHRFYALTNSVEAILNLALSLVLVHFIGLNGVALGTAIPMAVMRLVVQPVYTCKVLNMKVSSYLKVLTLSFLKAFMMGILIWVVATPFLQPSYFRLFIFGLGSSCGYFFFIYKIGFTDDERKYLEGLFQSIPVLKKPAQFLFSRT
ncbi:MAG: oligosaccharide flippase family protein [Candidatus Omnitrophica bacterium]|nr:oligosaccharide flippase family protein [Candidatus Omnitrophota bacterium]